MNQPLNTISLSPQMRRFICAFMLLLRIGNNSVLHAVGNETSRWDMALSELQIQSVSLHQPSLTEAWQAINDSFMVRTILYVRSSQLDTDVPFNFESPQKSTLKDVLDAFVAAYPDLTWTQDTVTGIIWIHPISMPYASLLSETMQIDTDQLGVVMLDDLMNTIASAYGNTIRNDTPQWGDTFNIPTNISQGTWAVRNLLNLCCQYEPAITFAVIRDDGESGIMSLHAVNIPSSISGTPDESPGVTSFARIELGWDPSSGPLDKFVLTQLVSEDPQKRTIARRLTSTLDRFISFEDQPSAALSCLDSLWITLGLASIEVRSEEAGYPPNIRAGLDRCAQDQDFLSNGDPQLALLCALETERMREHDFNSISGALKRYATQPPPGPEGAQHMADLQKKLANLQGAKSPLDTVLKRQFTPGQLSDVVSDVYRLVRHSPTLRGKFAAPGVADVLAKSDPRLAGLAKLNANPSIEAHR